MALLFAVLLRMSLACVLSVITSVGGVTVGSVSVMGSFLVVPALMVFGCFAMMMGGMAVMFGCFPMMFGSFFGH